MTRIQQIQERVGTVPDGFWGPKSVAACQRHLRAMMPESAVWPRPSQAALRAYYGAPDDNGPIVRVTAPDWIRLYDEPDRVVRSISVHERCAESLLRALEAAYPLAPDHVRRFFGCHVDRPMRGGSLPSLHAYGAAIDLAASTNRNHQHWPISADMPVEVMEAFAREGWTPAGAFWSRDAMHFQATIP